MTLTLQLLDKFGESWFYQKVAEEASEVIHDALKVIAIQTVYGDAKSPLELIQHKKDLLKEMAELRVYMDLLIDQMDAWPDFELNKDVQATRVMLKVQTLKVR